MSKPQQPQRETLWCHAPLTHAKGGLSIFVVRPRVGQACSVWWGGFGRCLQRLFSTLNTNAEADGCKVFCLWYHETSHAHRGWVMTNRSVFPHRLYALYFLGMVPEKILVTPRVFIEPVTRRYDSLYGLPSRIIGTAISMCAMMSLRKTKSSPKTVCLLCCLFGLMTSPLCLCEENGRLVKSMCDTF